MNVIGHPSGGDEFRFLVSKYAADVFVKFISEARLNQGLTVFGAEDDVVVEARQGLRHGRDSSR